jgi:hypothetical protein
MPLRSLRNPVFVLRLAQGANRAGILTQIESAGNVV